MEPARLLCPRDFLGKNTGVSCHFLLWVIFPTQELNPQLLPPSCIAGGFFTAEPQGINAREFEQTLGDSEGQGSLVCSPWGLRVRHDLVTEHQQTTNPLPCEPPFPYPPHPPHTQVLREHGAELPVLYSSCPRLSVLLTVMPI